MILSCTQDDDGPLSLSSSNVIFEGEGFFKSALLDSGNLIHLSKDTLYVHIDSAWIFSNCALEKISIKDSLVDSILVLKPIIKIKTSNKDCAAPFYRRDTTIKIVLGPKILKAVTSIYVMNDSNTILDTIIVRRGILKVDTFNIYIDSLFDSVHSLPIRTKGSPSIIKILDSITPRRFIWRTMKSKCELRIDACDSVKADTLFPSSWSLGDTNLVPIHYSCADSNLIYCRSGRWVNDSLELGFIQERPDTIWHTSTYYIEQIPECGALNSLVYKNFVAGNKMNVIRELYTPDDTEFSCGPSTKKDLYIFDIGRNLYLSDSVNVDSLYELWNSLKIRKNE